MEPGTLPCPLRDSRTHRWPHRYVEAWFPLHVLLKLWQVQGRGEGGYDVDEWSGVEHELSSDVDSRVIFTATVGRKEVGKHLGNVS